MSRFESLPILFVEQAAVAPGVISSFAIDQDRVQLGDLILVTDSLTELPRLGVVVKVVFKIKQRTAFKVIVEGTCWARLIKATRDIRGASGEAEQVDIELATKSSKASFEKKITKSLNQLIEMEAVGEELSYIFHSYLERGIESLFQFIVQLNNYFKVPFHVLSNRELTLLKNTSRVLENELDSLKLDEELQSTTEKRLDEQARINFLREKLQTIREELSKYEGDTDDIQNLKNTFLSKPIPEDIKTELLKQTERISRIPIDAPEYSMLRTHLDFAAELPWGIYTKDQFNLEKTREILNKNHYGQNQVKERIIEYLCVTHLTDESKSPILCFVGAPGVGKTSFAKSIAEALGRKFERISLGGIRDEAEIRGHRKAYIGSSAGRILQALKNAKTMNPVIVLDEIDKIGLDARGDPASALLEVLDPEQNSSFVDHYLGFPFDLSKVMFICTANSTSTIPVPLLDRLEEVEINGYSQLEKERIFQKFLLPKQIKANGLSNVHITVEKSAVSALIQLYTRESGLRGLDRETAKMCRKIAKIYLEKKFKKFKVDRKKLEIILGPPKYLPEPITTEAKTGVVIGLAWTNLGGELLVLESLVAPGKGNLILTGQLGTVMQESAKLALFYLQANAKKLNIPENFFYSHDIHVHATYGGVPKDGPSAGAALCLAIYSAITNIPLKNSISITGELSLTGQILEVGGIREKVLASVRYGIFEIILPKRNEKDIRASFNDEELNGIKFYFIERISEAFEILLLNKQRVK